jgi:CelD/BcsL family acetyltransferase involved in cellulose biosynthesis
MSTSLDIARVTDEQAFGALHEDWNALASRIPGSGLFLRHEWFDAAWRWARLEHELFILTVRDEGELVGLLPMVRHRGAGRFWQPRILEFLGTPDTQYAEALAVPTKQQAVLEALATYLHTACKDWDLLSLTKIPEGSPILQDLISSLKRRGCPARVAVQGNNPGVALTDTWDEYYARRSRRLKKGNNLVRNRLKKTFSSIRVATYTSADSSESLDSLVETLTTLSRKSWKRSTGLTLDQPGPQAFIHRLTEHALQQGWLSVWILYLDDRPAASEYQLVYEGTIHALRADFDSDFDEASPGTYLNMEILRSLFSGRATRYLMGPGENAYKLRWAEQFEPLHELTAYSTNPHARLIGVARLYALGPLKQRLRAIREARTRSQEPAK